MKILFKKLKSSFEMPIYGLGTWLMGGTKEKDPSNDDKKDINTIQMNVDMGVKLIFTAQNYADGYCEELVGRAIEKYDRKNIILCTAIRKENSTYDNVLKSFDESLNRLRTNYIDIIYHHIRYQDVPIKETMKAFNQLVDAGKAKNIAVSNYSTDSLKEAQDNSKYPIVANQVYYNLMTRESETSGLVRYCQENDVILQAYRPLGAGKLTLKGKYKIVDEMCKKYNMTPSQIALSWLTSQPNITVVCTTSNKQHLKENLEAVNWGMNDDDIEKLRKEFPEQIQVGECVKLE